MVCRVACLRATRWARGARRPRATRRARKAEERTGPTSSVSAVQVASQGRGPALLTCPVSPTGPGAIQVQTTQTKKPRVVWSVEMHQQFVAAVNQLGIDKAVPKRILDLMNVDGLTRENVASHLQKYRRVLLLPYAGWRLVPAAAGPAIPSCCENARPADVTLPAPPMAQAVPEAGAGDAERRQGQELERQRPQPQLRHGHHPQPAAAGSAAAGPRRHCSHHRTW